jgi:two-component system, cell cycle sensor histidine kinase and response regulator CckA
MPNLDGFGLVRAIREDAALAAVPVVLVTSSYVEPGDRELAARAGANAFVLRSGDLSEVLAAIETVLRQRSSPVLSDSREAWESERSVRTMQQLERQVVHNASLRRQCSTLAAELSVLSTVADALVEVRDLHSALGDVLSNCLDVVGAPRGAICLRDDAGVLSLAAHHGLSPAGVATLPALVERASADASGPAVVALSSVIDAADLVGASLSPGTVRARLSSRGEALGYLVLDVPSRAPDDWLAFAGVVANQVSFALALASSFDRLAASEARSRALMEHAADAIFAVGATSRIVDTNRAAERLTGLSRRAITARHLSDLLVDENEVGLTIADFANEDGAPVPRRLRRGDESLVDIEITSSRVDVGSEPVLLLVVRDVSARNAVAEQLRQAQKMDAIGQLAGGVAHDFNNLLAVILGYCDFASQAVGPDHAARSDLAEIKKAGESAANLTRQLLLFSREQPQQPKWVNLSDSVREMQKMLARILGGAITLSVELDPSPGLVWIDPGSIEQVIMNLVMNARDALPHGGTIRLITDGRPADDDNAEPSVLLSVVDDGSGMDSAVIARIFEPFFTTKAIGKGTGLGLSTVFGIVQRAGGQVELKSEPGNGSTFCVRLRRGDGPTAPTPSPRRSVTGGSETIVVVEPDRRARTIATGILRRGGYRVIEAEAPEAALELWRTAGDPIHLILSDATMPTMSGVELARRLHAIRPGGKLVCMAGTVPDPTDSDATADGSVAYVRKPITPLGLSEAVRAALDGRRPVPER